MELIILWLFCIAYVCTYYCDGKESGEVDVCNGNGYCIENEVCECNLTSSFGGKYCNISKCYGILATNISACGDFKCIDPDTCDCEPNLWADDCSFFKCFSVLQNNENVCNRKGNCTSPDMCDCKEPNYYGEQCEEFIEGKGSQYTDIVGSQLIQIPYVLPSFVFTFTYGFGAIFKCSFNGFINASWARNATCRFSSEVDIPTHLQIKFSQTPQPLKIGDQFIIHPISKLEEEIWIEVVEPIYCFNLSDLNPDVCSEHGSCISENNCSCVNTKLYFGDECNYWGCYCKSSLSSDVCGGKGVCVDFDTCGCFPGYGGDECKYFECFGFENNDPNVCSARGTCSETELCECDGGYEGQYCEIWSCSFFSHGDPRSCNSRGICVGPDDCKCDYGFTGDKCQTNALGIVLGITLPSTTGVILVSIIFVITFCSLFLCCCCVISVLFFLSCGISVLAISQFSKVQKFSKLKNFDILLREQLLEEDADMVSVHIDRSKFEIKMDDIILQSILGEGGSNSVVYKASWKNLTVAFKSFKTSQICSSQHHYDEFEKEVNVLGSLNHPYVIQCYGCSLKKPRVGIVMEFCCNGDIHEFLEKVKMENDNISYPIKEKIRLCSETAQAMEYLHTRNIFQRDLKCENDESEHCKVTDFGLSRIVDRMSKQKTTRIGTGIYMAPEIITDSRYDEKCDVFSFAIMLYIIFTENFMPYGKEESGNFVELKVSNDRNFRPDITVLKKSVGESYEWLANATRKCWNHDPNRRMSFSELSDLFSDKMNKKENVKNEGENNVVVDFFSEELQEVEEESDFPKQGGRKTKKKEVVVVDVIKKMEDLIRKNFEIFETVEEQKFAEVLLGKLWI